MINETLARKRSESVVTSPLMPALAVVLLAVGGAYSTTRIAPATAKAVCSSRTNATQAGLTFEQPENDTKKSQQTITVAESKGVLLPEAIGFLPDKTLDYLKSLGISPDFVNASEEGQGLMIEFHKDAIYHMVEFYPDGDIVLLIGDNAEKTWDLTSENYLTTLQTELT